MSDHRLPTAEHEAVYADIERKYLPRAHPQERPRAIITGGQPGSGKSGITSAAQAELAGQGGYVLVDADKLRDRHRDYQRLMQEDDRTAANETHANAGAWAGRLYRAARDSHREIRRGDAGRASEVVAGRWSRRR